MSEIFEPSLTQDMIDYMKIKATYDPARLDGIDASLAQKATQTDLKDIAKSVKDFGAKGDGVTDDTVAIQAAFDSTYASIYFPPGTYIVTNTLTVNPSHKVIYGLDYHQSIIQCTATTNIDIIYLNNNGAWFTTIRDLQIVGNSNAQQTGIHVFPTSNSTSYFNMDHIYIQNCYGYGFKIDPNGSYAAYHCIFTNLYVENVGTGMYAYLSDSVMDRCYFYGANLHGLQLAGFNCRVSNLKLAQNGRNNRGANGYGLLVQGARNVYNNIDVQENCGIGVYFDDNTFQNIIRNAIIDGNGCSIPSNSGTSDLLYQGFSMGGTQNELHGIVSDYTGRYQIRGFVKRYYALKGCVINVTDSTTRAKSFDIKDATPIQYIMKKASDLPASIVPNGTPATPSSYESVTYGSKTVTALKLPPDNKLSFDVTNQIDRTFNLSFLMKVTFTGTDVLSYINFVSIGTFLNLAFYNKGFLTSLGGATANMGGTMTTGDIYSVSINAVCTSANTYQVYTYIYKFNPTSGNFESFVTQNRTYDFTTQTNFATTIGFNNKSDSPGLVIDVWNVSMGAPYINADQITYVTNQQLNSNNAIYIPCNGNLNPQTIV